MEFRHTYHKTLDGDMLGNNLVYLQNPFLRAAGLQEPGLLQTVEETNLITKKPCTLTF